MKPRHQRFAWIAAGVILLGSAAALVLTAFEENIVFFHTPSEVASGQVPQGRNFRLGGMVVADSIVRDADGLTVRFQITDTAKQIPVVYKGALPDLFKPGKGAVCQGSIDANGVFTATEVLAKHDENYMPPEAQDAIDRAHSTARSLQSP